jgi:hypothetical protein
MAGTLAGLCLGRIVSSHERDYWCCALLTKFFLDPYVHEPQVQTAIQAVGPNGNFSVEEMAMIDGRNALAVFPSVAEKLGMVS